MKYTVRGVLVDSGEFVVADPAVLGCERGCESGCTEFRVPNGTYRVFWNLLNGPLSKHTGRGTLKVVSRRLWVVDPTYVSDTYDWEHPPRGVVVVDKTGGDGHFDVTFILTKK